MNGNLYLLGDLVGSFVPKRLYDSGFGGRLGTICPTLFCRLEELEKGDNR